MKKYILNQLGVRLAVFLLIPVLLVRPVDFLVSLFAPRLVSNHIQIAYFVAVTIRAYLIAFPILCLMMKPLPPKTPERRPMGFRAFLGMLCALGCVMFFGARIGDALDSFLHSFAGEGLPGFVRKTGFKELLWADFMMAGIFAPITEELAFRKFLLDRALPKCGTGMSVLLSGLMFGLAHGNFDQFFFAAGTGLVLAWVYISTGNVIYTILGHMAINMRAVLREGLLHRALENPLMARYEEGKIGLLELWRGRDTAVVLYLADELLVGLIVLAGLILLTVLLVRYLKKRKQGLPVPAEAAAAAEEPEAPAAATEPEAPAAAEEPEAPVPAAAPVRRRKQRVLLGSLGMWFYLLVTLAFFVLNYI